MSDPIQFRGPVLISRETFNKMQAEQRKRDEDKIRAAVLERNGDGEELDLYTISLDPLAPAYSEPRAIFKNINIRPFLGDAGRKWAYKYLSDAKVRLSTFYDCLYDLVEIKEQRAEFEPFMAEVIDAVAKCYKYSSVTRKWKFVASDSLDQLPTVIRESYGDEEFSAKAIMAARELELQKLARRFRSKSVDSGLADRVSDFNALKRSPSCMKFVEVKAYAEKKMKATINDLATDYDARKNEKEMDEEALGAEILDVSRLFHGHQDPRRQQALIERMLRSKSSYKAARQDKDLHARHIHLKKLLETTMMYCGVRRSKRNIPTGSIVMDEYYKFEKYKRSLMFFGIQATRGLKKLIKPHNMLLVSTWDKVFHYHTCLVEHILNLIARQVFNPYAIYKAESTQDVAHIQEVLGSVRGSMELVKNALFNVHPLQRQLGELDQLNADPTISKEHLKQTVATLGRYAIERLRIPQSFPGINTTSYSFWLNSSTEFKSSFDVFNFAVEDVGDTADCNDELTEHYFDATAIAKLSAPLIPNSKNNLFEVLLAGFFLQNKKFYQSLDALMPGNGLDVTMATYYKHQAFVGLYDLVMRRKKVICTQDIKGHSNAPNTLLFAAIIAHCKQEYSIRFVLTQLDLLHGHLGEYPAVMSPVEPIHIGTAVVVLKDTLSVSVVNEQEIPSKAYEYPKTSVVQPGEDHRAVKLNEDVVIHFMVTPDGMLSVAFQSNTAHEKNDRVVLGRVNQRLIKPTVEWRALVASFVEPSLNRLKESIQQSKGLQRRVFEIPGNRYWPLAIGSKSQIEGMSRKRSLALMEGYDPEIERLIEDSNESCTFVLAKKRPMMASDVRERSAPPQLR